MDFDQARINMIKQQIRTCGVHDETVLEVIAKTPRERFVPEPFKALAFADFPIPIGHGQFMLCPKEEAQILQSLQLKGDEKVLEVGTGSGYFTALLAQQAKQIISVDIIASFMTPAAKRLTELEISNTTFTSGNAALGWESYAPYDIIVITGSLRTLPRTFLEQLSVGGRLFAILGQEPAMTATLITHEAADHWQELPLFETVVTPLQEVQRPDPFIF